eukprot:298920-Chlamydomonas_euryale.AAC.2
MGAQVLRVLRTSALVPGPAPHAWMALVANIGHCWHLRVPILVPAPVLHSIVARLQTLGSLYWQRPSWHRRSPLASMPHIVVVSVVVAVVVVAVVAVVVLSSLDSNVVNTL